MRHDEALDIILNPGRLPEPGSEEFRELKVCLETSPELRQIYEQQRLLWSALDEWTAVEPSVEFNRSLWEKIDTQRARPWHERFFPDLQPAFALGVAALILAAAGVVLQRPDFPGGQQTAGLLPADDIEYLEEIEREFDDIEMLADFAVLPLGG